MRKIRRENGVTLLEILLVVGLLAILALLGYMGWRVQISKSLDAKRKSDLNELKIAFEGYYDDHGCYPPVEIVEDCGGTGLQPYMQEVLCDPSGEPYDYHLADDQCTGFEIYTRIDWEKDPVIVDVGCGDGCGSGGEYDYGLSTIGDLGIRDARPVEDEDVGAFACDPDGICNMYDDPIGSGCPVTFVDGAECQAACDESPENWCAL